MNDLTVVYYTDIHCIIDIKKEIEMTNYETLQQICERAKENIDMLNASGKLDALSNAAVYPGVTVYGETFEPIHDAVKVSLVRNVNDSSIRY